MSIPDRDLLDMIGKLRATMTAVATGGPRIDEVNHEYQQQYRVVADELEARGIENPNPYADLWQWYGKWSADIPGYGPRRTFLADMYSPVVALIRSGRSAEIAPTGWARVDRTVTEARERLPRARTEEQFQAIGLMCREVLISLAQEVFDPEKHPTQPGINVSSSDFKRMIEAFIAVELRGGAAEAARKHAHSALDLALRLQHQRTAGFRGAALCVEATNAVVSIIAIVTGRRDPAD